MRINDYPGLISDADATDIANTIALATYTRMYLASIRDARGAAAAHHESRAGVVERGAPAGGAGAPAPSSNFRESSLRFLEGEKPATFAAQQARYLEWKEEQEKAAKAGAGKEPKRARGGKRTRVRKHKSKRHTKRRHNRR